MAAAQSVLDDLKVATGEDVAVGPVDHVDSHGKPTKCGAYIDPDSVRLWSTGFTMNVRVPHWAGGLQIRMAATRKFQFTDV